MVADPSLSAYDHIEILNRHLYPAAGILADPVNRLLILKAPPFD
jgi:hypothetical protein